MIVTQNITQDLTRPIVQVVYSKVGDTNRKVAVTVKNSGVAWNVPAGATCVLYAKDNEGNYYTSNSVTFSGNVVTATLPAFSQRGTASTEIEISSGGQIVATLGFYTEIYKSA